MNRLIVTSSVFIIIGITAAACAVTTPMSSAGSSGYFTDVGAPLITPSAQGQASDTTAEKQRASGYYPDAGAPLVVPTEGNSGSDATARKQSTSGYFPEAGAPLVSHAATGVR